MKKELVCGKQVVAFTKFHNHEKNKAAAKLLKMFENGKSYAEVREAKGRL